MLKADGKAENIKTMPSKITLHSIGVQNSADGMDSGKTSAEIADYLGTDTVMAAGVDRFWISDECDGVYPAQHTSHFFEAIGLRSLNYAPTYWGWTGFSKLLCRNCGLSWHRGYRPGPVCKCEEYEV